MQRIKSKLLSLLLIFSLCIGMVGIINVDTTYAASKKIHLKKTTVSIVAGKTYQQKLIDKKGKTIKATKVKWKSTKTSIAKISKKGLITAVKSGTVKMTAKYKGKTYKFTVKVKKPFASSDKPKLYKVENDDGCIITYWTKLKNAKKYQVFVSTNGGKYVLCEECPELFGYFGDVKVGNTYSFKVRGVAGKHYSKFSEVKTIKYTDSQGESEDPYIILEKESYNVSVGDTVVVKAFTNDGGTTGYTAYSNGCYSILARDTGYNDKGQHYEHVTIKGIKAGTASIVFTVGNNKEVRKTVTINVIDDNPKDISTLVNYLKTNGEITVSNTNSSGTRYTSISLSSDGQSIMFSNFIDTKSGKNSSISQQSFAIDVDFDNYIDKAYFYYRWDFYPNGDTSVTDYSYRMYSYVNGRTYTPGDDINWTVSQAFSGMSPQELGLFEGASSQFESAIGYWNSALNSKLGMNLSNVGMINCN